MRNVRTIFILFLFTLLVMSICFSIDGLSNSIYINNDDFEEYSSIQDAINSAIINDTIYVSSGYYNENIIINKPIKLIGENKSNTIIDGNGLNCVQIESNDVYIKGFTLRNSSKNIFLHNCSNCTITNNTIASSFYGCYIEDNCFNNTIFYNNFILNDMQVIDYGLTYWYQDQTGNYWDNYNGVDLNNDGIGDSEVLINENNIDKYPLINPITMIPYANFWFDPANPTTASNISFNDISTDHDGTIVRWFWDFGDGSNSSLEHPEHKYDDDGTYIISLTIIDNLGAIDVQKYTINIANVPPVAYFTFNPKVPLDIQEVDFRDESIDNDGLIIDRMWRINSEVITKDELFEYMFPDNGSYTVELVVTDDDNMTSSYSERVSVLNVGPMASFSFYTDDKNFTEGKNIIFNDNSKDLDGTIVSYCWDFGDGTKSYDKNTNHYYGSNGDKTVTLTVYDNDGEMNSVSKHVILGEIEEGNSILSGLSLLNIIFVIVIIIAVIIVIIVSKKYTY